MDVLVDSNLVVLHGIGSADPAWIAKHKRTAEFTASDFELLTEFLSRFEQLLTTPNILTEVSNRVRQGLSDERLERVSNELAQFAEFSDERFIASGDATKDACHARLGLTDAAILRLSEVGVAVVTTVRGSRRS
ncbi:MAG: hypothetical protein K8S98_04670 [Planctomycetes bacterium]|nr:hypothetical protein [Planctomycetota bacterium]